MSLNRRFLLCGLMLPLILSGCSGKFSKYNYTNYIKLKEPPKVSKLHPTPLMKGVNFLVDLEVMGKYLVFVDMKAENAVKIFDINSHKVLASFGKKGQGPGEFVGSPSITRDPQNENNLWLYDLSARSLKKI